VFHSFKIGLLKNLIPEDKLFTAGAWRKALLEIGRSVLFKAVLSSATIQTPRRQSKPQMQLMPRQ